MAKKISIRRLSAMLKKKEVILVDVMAEEIHQKIHISGAINIPFTKLEHDCYILLDPRAVIITYSIDYDCPVSRFAADKLKELGFQRVFYFPGGLKQWLEANLPVVKSAAPAAN